jgi:hypothetical protein
VSDWEEEDYAIRPGDTYAAISKARFGSEKYAAALEQFNRDHPRLGSDVRAAEKQGGPGLKPGLKIALPAAAVLEERYGSFITGPAKETSPPPIAPTGAPATGTTAPPPGPGAAAPAPRTTRYLVKSNGEFVRAIAGTTLNNRDRWGEIATLNPGLDPTYPVRPGTILNLPADARIPAANTAQ